jgi:hypothetical protein
MGRWVIRTGTPGNEAYTHVAFIAAGVLSVPALAALVIVASRTSGVARDVATLGAIALGLLIVWTVALMIFMWRTTRAMQTKR